MDHIVIGSGPAGVATATALLARGQRVTMLDGGQMLEPDRVAARDHLAARDPAEWREDDRNEWQAAQSGGAADQVRRYGSDFAMAPASETFAQGQDEFLLRASQAVGGLSNLWGAAVLPYADADMAGWPIGTADLAPHYRAVAEFLPVAGRQDDLAGLFPALPMAGYAALTPSPQAEALLARLAQNRAKLAAMGLTAGQARQAVSADCRQCGQCLHGCPWGLIWSAAKQVARLKANPGFTHRPGTLVRSFVEDAEGITLRLASGEDLRGARAYLAAGVLGTARILLTSHPVLSMLTVKDSAHGFLPALHGWGTQRRPDHGRFHTLPQAFLELAARDVSPHLIHSQLYSWNDHFERDLIARYGRRLPGSAPLWRALARRLIVAQIFLHSDHSAQARLTLAADGRLRAEVQHNPATAALFADAARRVGAGLKLTGLAPLPFAARLNPAGSSFHAGGSLPMRTSATAPGTDILGRPLGMTRLHVTDASILPAIPATTITFAVMANAHRIGSLAP